MCSQSNRSAHCGGQQLHLGGQLSSGPVSQQRGNRDADKGVQPIPQQIEPGNFIGDELRRKERSAHPDNPPTG